MLKAVFEHLRDARQFVAVEIAEEVNAIIGRAPEADDGTVFVVPVREKAGPQRNIVGAHQQRVDVQFAIAILFREHGDPRGAERALRFDDRKYAVEQLMAGWQPAGAAEGFALVGGQADPIGNGVSIYTLLWQTTRFLIGDQP
jgi:hypothetical protein